MEAVVNRISMTKIHLILAAFMFPAVIIFLITGGLYTWGIKGSYESADYPVPLERPLVKDETALSQLLRAELARRGIDEPTGTPRIRTIADGYQLEWTGSKRDVLLEPTSDPLQAKLIVLETSWYRNLVQLHKAKGGFVFKVYAAALAVALFMMLTTGVLMAWSVPRFRRVVTISAFAGLAACIAAIATS
jgi:hypothetical protein